MSINGALMSSVWARWPTDWVDDVGRKPEHQSPAERRQPAGPAAECHVAEGCVEHRCEGDKRVVGERSPEYRGHRRHQKARQEDRCVPHQVDTAGVIDVIAEEWVQPVADSEGHPGKEPRVLVGIACAAYQRAEGP